MAEKVVKRATCLIDNRLLDKARELAIAERITISQVLERDLIPAIAKRHRKLREKQAAELQASDLGGEASVL